MYSLVFQMLNCAQTLKCPIDHDGQTSTKGFTFFHTVDANTQSNKYIK